MSEQNKLNIGPEQAGQRLDKSLSLLGLSLRAARRLCLSGQVCVNGRPCREAHKLKTGDIIEIKEESGSVPSPTEADAPAPASLLAQNKNLAALYKTAGLHSVRLAGGKGPNLEEALPRILPACTSPDYPRLLNRLDCPTSGLVLVALNEQGLAAWNSGKSEKRYLALLQGTLHSALTVTSKINPANPHAVRVEQISDPDPDRYTQITPLGSLPEDAAASLGLEKMPAEGLSLAACCIRRGARHQIRAHAAHVGFPLLGDVRYGGEALPSALAAAPCRGEFFYLHHGYVKLPGFSASCPPPWLGILPPELQQAGLDWLKIQP